MKKLLGLLILASAALAVAQDAPPPSQGTPPQPPPPPQRPTPALRALQQDAGMGEEMILVTFLQRRGSMQQLELSKEQSDALTAEMKKIDDQIAKIQGSMPEAIQKQAELVKEAKPDNAAVMAAVEKVWNLRMEQAKLQTQKILVIKNGLTVEQQKKALELIQQGRPARQPRQPRTPANRDTPPPPDAPPPPAKM